MLRLDFFVTLGFGQTNKQSFVSSNQPTFEGSEVTEPTQRWQVKVGLAADWALRGLGVPDVGIPGSHGPFTRGRSHGWSFDESGGSFHGKIG